MIPILVVQTGERSFISYLPRYTRFLYILGYFSEDEPYFFDMVLN